MSNDIATQVMDIVAENLNAAREKVVLEANFIEDLGMTALIPLSL